MWRLPNAQANARGRSFNNLLPLEAGERITTILPLPEDEAHWDRLDIMFATTTGGVRRNKLSDFTNVNRAGKIAMKLDEGQHLVGVSLCNAGEDVLLTTALPAAPSASRWATCACSPAATPTACAASAWPRATRSSP